MAEAMDREESGQLDAALQQATDALRSAPGLTPAAVMAARLLTARDELRSARRTLVNAWRIEPHPDVAEAFAALAPDETPDERLKRFEKLFTVRPDAPETKVLKAELALAAEKPDVARAALDDVCETAPSARAFALMAAIEQEQGASEAIVRGWLSRAASAPREPKWVCAKCGTTASHWNHSCVSCDAFDQMVWKRVEGDENSLGKAITALLSKSRTEDVLPEPEAPKAVVAERDDAAEPPEEPVSAAKKAAIEKAAAGTALVRLDEDEKPRPNGGVRGAASTADATGAPESAEERRLN
jgi:HemY protein